MIGIGLMKPVGSVVSSIFVEQIGTNAWIATYDGSPFYIYQVRGYKFSVWHLGSRWGWSEDFISALEMIPEYYDVESIWL